MTKMTTIKIPSPPMTSLNVLAQHYGLEARSTDMAVRYMNNVTKRLADINDLPFQYQNFKIREDGIYVDVDFDNLGKSLLTLDEMTRMYGNTLLHKEFRKRVAKVYADDNDNNLRVNEMVTTAEGKNRLLMNQPFSEWPPRWITIYLWTLIGADISHDSTVQLEDNRMLSDADICHKLLLEIESFEIY